MFLVGLRQRVCLILFSGVFAAGVSHAQALDEQAYPPGNEVSALEATHDTATSFDLDRVSKQFENRFPGVVVTAVRPTPYQGLYEVQVGDDLLYSDAQVLFVMQGSLIDAIDRTDLTAQRLQNLNQVNFSELPLDLAIKQVTGDGSRVMVAFEDPNCGFCRQLHATLTQIDNVTIYTFLYPILSPDSHEKARNIWCADDTEAAWREWMLNRVNPVKRECDTPIQEITRLARSLRITGTPALFFPDNTRVNGAMPLEGLRAKLDSLEGVN